MTQPQERDDSESAQRRSAVRRFFDGLAVNRNDAINANPIIRYEQDLRGNNVLNLLSAKPGGRILDIGCGNARDIEKLVEAGTTVVGTDISEGMISAARRALKQDYAAHVDLAVGDATRLAYADDSFDGILCSEVIEHIPQPALALQEMYRVLKPGAQLVLSTPNRHSWYGFDRYFIYQGLLRRHWNHPCDQWRTVSELKTLATQGGFEISHTRTACYIPGFLVTYFALPRFLQNFLVAMTKLLEPVISKLLPGIGYTILLLASKPRETTNA